MKKLWKKIIDWWEMHRHFEKMEDDIFKAETIRFKKYQIDAMMVTDSQRWKK